MKIKIHIFAALFIFTAVLTVFADEIKVYPVPWVPDGANTQKTGTLSGGIIFNNLPMNGEIFIYNVTGNLVRKIEFKNKSSVQWFGKNDNDEDLASGVYIWMVKPAEGSKIKGKLIIIR